MKVLDEDREHVFFEADPLMLLNGVPVLDFNRIIQYDPLNIRKLDIIARTYYYGDMAFAGVLNFIGWSPDIKTSAKGEKGIGFYSSNVTRKFEVVLQGISQDGKTGTREIEFEINDKLRK